MKKLCLKCGKNEAMISPSFGVMDCKSCQSKDRGVKIRKGYDASHPFKLHRLQQQRDQFAGDMLQPFIGTTPNKDFFKRYPDKVSEYGVGDELAKM